jgi:hypothetical protein
VLQQNGAITAIGAFEDLHRDNPGAPVIGDGQQVLLPGFVNAHHHIGLSTVQLGISDTTLERALVRDQYRYARPHPLLRYTLFVFRDGGLRHDHGAAPARLDPRRPQTDRSGGRVHHSRLRRYRHADLVLLRVAGAEPSRLRGQRWLSESDLDKLAATHTSVCHNCSSNFRLRSGVLPLNRLEARGINTAIGLDDVGINDDQDMLQEMRMVLRAHREPGMDDRVPTMAQVFRMATSGGAQTTPYATEIGTLEIGKVLIDWKQISYPYLDSETPVLGAVIQRAKMEGVRTVIVAGEIVYQDGKFTRLDRDAALAQLADILKRPLTGEQMERRRLAKAVFPYVKSFYDGYYNPDESEPYYRQNSRI